MTLTIPAEAMAPTQLCGVRFCVIPDHWRTAHLIQSSGETLYVDGERWPQ